MSLWRPDPTFYPSPKLAMLAPPEKLAYVAMLNANGKQRSRTLEEVLAGSSETARGALQSHRSSLPTGTGRSKTKIQSDPHGDMRS